MRSLSALALALVGASVAFAQYGDISDLKIARPEDKQDVEVDMTLTSPGCPAHVTIGEQVKDRLEALPGVKSARVNVVWTPPWSPDRLSEAAKKQLGIEV